MTQEPSFKWHTEVKNGKRRRVGVPNTAMRRIQRRLKEELESDANEYTLLFNATCIRDSNILRNAWWHRGNQYFYCIDLLSAFESVRLDMLVRMLSQLSTIRWHYPDFESYIATHCMDPKGGLVRGANASPLLFNLYCGDLDQILHNLYQDYNITYTRYMDDLTFSSPKPITRAQRRYIRDVIEKTPYEFRINHRKSRLLDLTKGSVVITGVQLMPDGTIAPTEVFLKKFEKWVRTPADYAWNEKEIKCFQGMLAFLSMFKGRSIAPPSPRTTYLLRKGERLGNRLWGKKEYPRWFYSESMLNTIDLARAIMQIRKSIVLKARLRSIGTHGHAALEWKGLCPFHNERTPSFTVCERGRSGSFYHCFGCGAHGDLVGFLMQGGMEFREALQWIRRNYDDLPKYADRQSAALL